MNSSTTTLTGGAADVFIYIVAVCAAVLVLITFLIVFFVIKYNRKSNPHPKDIHGNVPLEIVWTVIPTILFLSFFYFGWTNWEKMRSVPHDAMKVNVIARQWSWSFKYANGKESDVLRLPVNHAVRCNLHSLDVIHGFFIPAFQVKEDVVPGLHNYAWFEPTDHRVLRPALLVLLRPGPPAHDYQGHRDEGRGLHDLVQQERGPGRRGAGQDALRDQGLQGVPHHQRD